MAGGLRGTRVVRLDTGEGAPLEYAPASWDAVVRVDADAFEAALARLVLAVLLTLRATQAGALKGLAQELLTTGSKLRHLVTEGQEE